MSTFTVQLTNQLITRSWDLLEKPTVAQLANNFSIFYGTQRFITVFTRARWIWSIPPHPLSLRTDAASNAAVPWPRWWSCKMIRLIEVKNVGKRHHSLIFWYINLIWCECEKFSSLQYTIRIES
jgi:hypothetical protein